MNANESIRAPIAEPGGGVWAMMGRLAWSMVTTPSTCPRSRRSGNRGPFVTTRWPRDWGRCRVGGHGRGIKQTKASGRLGRAMSRARQGAPAQQFAHPQRARGDVRTDGFRCPGSQGGVATRFGGGVLRLEETVRVLPSWQFLRLSRCGDFLHPFGGCRCSLSHWRDVTGPEQMLRIRLSKRSASDTRNPL